MAHDPHSKAALARHRLIGQLRASEVPGAEAVSDVLAACTPAAPCRSAACPVCGLASQATAVSLVEELISTPARAIRNRMTAITLVPASGIVAPEALSVEDFERVGAEITVAFAALALPAAIIGLEASFNEDTTGRFEDHWCVHGHANQFEWLSEVQTSGLRARFPPSRLVRQPVDCKPLDQRSQGRNYPFKPERVRRVTVWVTDHPLRAPYRDSKRRPLRPWQAVSLAIVEHELGFARRLRTHGIDERLIRGRLWAAGWGRDGP